MVNKPIEQKPKSLFDHLSEIREHKSEDYYDLLTDEEKKSFNQYIILIGLSMDKECIDITALLSKYLNIIPDREFYKVCCDLIPLGRKYSKWVKSGKDKINKELVDKVALYYEVGKADAVEYCECMYNSGEAGMANIKSILSKYGMTEKEIKGILK